jgi:phosphoribosylpyrophosphate synthetase
VQALQEAGAQHISMYVTHAVFPQNSWQNFTKPLGGVNVKNFWITDSIPHALEISEVPPFKLIPLCDVIADSLLGYDLLSYNQ